MKLKTFPPSASIFMQEEIAFEECQGWNHSFYLLPFPLAVLLQMASKDSQAHCAAKNVFIQPVKVCDRKLTVEFFYDASVFIMLIESLENDVNLVVQDDKVLDNGLDRYSFLEY